MSTPSAVDIEARKLQREVEGLRAKNAELSRELAALRTYYEDLLSSLQDAVIVVDRSLRIIFLNGAAEELLAVSAGSVRGRPFAEALSPAAHLGTLLAKTLEAGRGHADFDSALGAEGPGRRRVSAVASLLADAEGEARGAVLVLRDISRIQELEDRIRHSERLAALGVLAAGMAHEIKNPLAGIRAATQLLEQEPSFPPFFREYTAVIIREVDRLSRLLNSLLSFASPRHPVLKPGNVNQVLEEVLSLEEARLKAQGVTIQRIYDPTIPSILGDPEQLVQIFLNLVKNAAEAMPGGGEVTVRTRFERFSPRCGGRPVAVVDVEDRGPGLSPEARKNLFNPFFTTKEHGTGLGLAISLRIIEDHGGTIEASGEPGKGAVFSVLLPLAPASGSGAAA